MKVSGDLSLVLEGLWNPVVVGRMMELNDLWMLISVLKDLWSYLSGAERPL